MTAMTGAAVSSNTSDASPVARWIVASPVFLARGLLTLLVSQRSVAESASLWSVT
jgi:sirohydrochlorin ferrochelatase